jgi:hypothetical protein
MCATCPTQLVLLILVIIVVFNKECKLRRSLLRNCRQPPVTAPVLAQISFRVVVFQIVDRDLLSSFDELFKL